MFLVLLINKFILPSHSLTLFDLYDDDDDDFTADKIDHATQWWQLHLEHIDAHFLIFIHRSTRQASRYF